MQFPPEGSLTQLVQSLQESQPWQFVQSEHEPHPLQFVQSLQESQSTQSVQSEQFVQLRQFVLLPFSVGPRAGGIQEVVVPIGERTERIECWCEKWSVDLVFHLANAERMWNSWWRGWLLYLSALSANVFHPMSMFPSFATSWRRFLLEDETCWGYTAPHGFSPINLAFSNAMEYAT